MTKLRVAQWATGNIGTRSLQGVIDHPELDLVGLWVHSEDKVGRDAGDLADRSATGVSATRDIDEIVALGADCVLYMPRSLDVDEVCRLLESGANVVTTRGELHHPASMEPAVRDRIDAACTAGGTSIHSTGSSPGFITEAVPLVLTSILRRIDSVIIDEYADLSQRDSPDLLFNIMGFGAVPSEIPAGRLEHGKWSFGPSLRVFGDAIGLPLDDVTASGEVAVAPRDLEIAAGTIKAGTVVAQRTAVVGMHQGRELIQFRSNWYCSTDIAEDWDLRPTGWRITTEGDAPLDANLRFPFDLDEMAARSPGYTANRAVNAVAAVCGAEPGIRTSTDLPQIIARF